MGISATKTSRIIPPPIPVSIPSSARHHRIQPIAQSLLRARDCKKPKPCGIEKQYEVAHSRRIAGYVGTK